MKDWLILAFLAGCGDKEAEEGDADADADSDADTDTDTDADADADTDADTDADPAVDADGDGWFEGEDCDDADAAVNPDAVEVCDERDNDCDGSSDEASAADAVFWYADDDGDGFGDPYAIQRACAPPAGFVGDATDCDDADAGTNPGASETCDGEDEDCDGDTDEASAIDAPAWYADADGDGYGDPAAAAVACEPPAGHVGDATDCDDADAGTNPGGTEVCDGLDNDCDGALDLDDGAELTTWYSDADGDGYGVGGSAATTCGAPSGYAAKDGDCDDTDADVHPGASEPCSTGRDKNCDWIVTSCSLKESSCADGSDDDMDGGLDCEDGDCASAANCLEICWDGKDNEGDGLTDCDDDDCWATNECGAYAQVLGGRAEVRRRSHREWRKTLSTYTTVLSGGTAWDYDRSFRSKRGSRLDVYSVSGLLQLNSGATSCLWYVDHAWELSYAGTTLFWPGTSMGYFDTSGMGRAGFRVSSACPVQAASFLPYDLSWGGYAGESGMKLGGKWWYHGEVSRTASVDWRSSFSSATASPRWASSFGSSNEAFLWEFGSLSGDAIPVP